MMLKSKIKKKPNQVSTLPQSEPQNPNEYLIDTPQSCTFIHQTPTAAIIPPATKSTMSYIKQEEPQNNIKKFSKSANHRPVDDDSKNNPVQMLTFEGVGVGDKH